MTGSGSLALACTPQLLVQLAELAEEATVGEDPSVLPYREDCLPQGELLMQHEVSQDQRGRAAHTHHTVH